MRFSLVASMLLVGWSAAVAEGQFIPRQFDVAPPASLNRGELSQTKPALGTPYLRGNPAAFQYQDDAFSVLDSESPVAAPNSGTAFDSSLPTIPTASRITRSRFWNSLGDATSGRNATNRMSRQEIRSMDILDRPNRRFHFYGNTVRRRSESGSTIPTRSR